MMPEPGQALAGLPEAGGHVTVGQPEGNFGVQAGRPIDATEPALKQRIPLQATECLVVDRLNHQLALLAIFLRPLFRNRSAFPSATRLIPFMTASDLLRIARRRNRAFSS
jgi:hypothetical protein